ncbi:hypothetical protein C8R43DRAFT_1173395 [Mycena crocata]|nr:hypothetical protein C8R43DRAFT_1173395 [Mycena crocata]
MATLAQTIPTTLDTPGLAMPGAYPLSRTQSHAEQSSVLAGAQAYLPGGDDVQRGLTNAGQAAKAHLPSGIAGYFAAPESEPAETPDVLGADAKTPTRPTFSTSSSSAQSAGTDSSASTAASSTMLDPNICPRNAGYSQLGSTPSLPASLVLGASDSSANSIPSSLASSKYAAPVPPTSLASDTSAKFISWPLHSSQPEPQSRIDGALIPVAGEPGSASAPLNSAPQGTALHPPPAESSPLAANSTSVSVSPPFTPIPPVAGQGSGVSSVYFPLVAGNLASTGNAADPNTAARTDEANTDTASSNQPVASNDVLAFLAAEGVAQYLASVGLSGPPQAQSEKPSGDEQMHNADTGMDPKLKLAPPALEWEAGANTPTHTYTHAKTQTPSNGHTHAEDAQRAEFSGEEYGLLGKEEDVANVDIDAAYKEKAAGAAHASETAAAVWTVYGVHPTAPDLGTQATGVSDDVVVHSMSPDNSNTNIGPEDTDAKDKDAKPEKRRSRLVAKIKEKMHVG